MLFTQTTLVLVPRKLRTGWVVATECSGRGRRITVPTPVIRAVAMDAILFHFVNRREPYPSKDEAIAAATAIALRCISAARNGAGGERREATCLK